MKIKDHTKLRELLNDIQQIETISGLSTEDREDIIESLDEIECIKLQKARIETRIQDMEVRIKSAWESFGVYATKNSSYYVSESPSAIHKSDINNVGYRLYLYYETIEMLVSVIDSKQQHVEEMKKTIPKTFKWYQFIKKQEHSEHVQELSTLETDIELLEDVVRHYNSFPYIDDNVSALKKFGECRRAFADDIGNLNARIDKLLCK